MTKRRIVDIRAYVLDEPEMGGDYNRREAGHWLVDDLVATPMSIYPEYRDSATAGAWGCWEAFWSTESTLGELDLPPEPVAMLPAT